MAGRRQTRRTLNLDKIVGAAIRGGLDKLYLTDRATGVMQEGLVDVNGLYHAAEEISRKTRYSPERVAAILADQIHSHGNYITERGKEMLLDRRVEYRGYGKWASVRHPIATIKHKVNPTYMDKAFKAASEIYDFMAAGGYEGTLPEQVKRDITELKNLDFYDAMVHILKDKGIIWGSVARATRHNIRKKAKKEMIGLVEKVKQRTATAILLVAGTFLLALSSANITGFVVAGNSIPAGYPAAAGFIILAVALFLSFLRRKPKKAKAAEKNKPVRKTKGRKRKK